jgi:hypothetical protein
MLITETLAAEVHEKKEAPMNGGGYGGGGMAGMY